MKFYTLTALLLLSTLTLSASKPASKPQPTNDTCWWVGITALGDVMPVSKNFKGNIIADSYGNQVQPLLLSNKGDVVWSEEPFEVKIENGKVDILQAKGEIIKTKAGNSLKEAYLYASNHYFPSQHKLPDATLFSAPQYNTWIELMYNQNQADILKYAHAIIDNGFPAGVLMIDDNWQEDYGKWNFHATRFPNPKAMIQELHGLGFKVMLWVCPFVSADCDVYRDLVSKGAFLNSESKTVNNSTLPTLDFRGNVKPEMVAWWNGLSAVLDLSNPIAEQWFKGELKKLQTNYGIDGFKFDAGDAEFYARGTSKGKVSANTQTELFGKIGLDFPLNEYRAMWKMGGQPLVQRLRDKAHSWSDLQKLVPSMMVQGLMGYYYNCPDMIGGGDFTSFLSVSKIDEELIVRSAQCHALMPMMQFSVAPWRILSAENLKAVKAAVQLRQKFSAYILTAAKNTAATGIPIIRPLEFDYPNRGYENISNQFLLGDSLLVAPIVDKGISSLKIMLPQGNWKYKSGKVFKGNRQIEVAVTIADLPYFERVK